MYLQNILLMLEIYMLILFCTPLPVICAGNAAGIICSAALIAVTFYFKPFSVFLISLWHSCAAARILIVTVFSIFFIIAVYLIILSAKMLSAKMRTPPRSLPCTVVILGCRVRGTRPSRMLRKRLNAAYDFLCENPHAVCIVSGGRGSDEKISEAQAMRRYLLDKGLDKNRVYSEDKSSSTLENLKFSQRIIEARNLPDTVAIATDGFHLYRAALIAEQLGIRSYAVPSVTEPRYAPTYWVREWFAIILYKIKFFIRRKNERR